MLGPFSEPQRVHGITLGEPCRQIELALVMFPSATLARWFVLLSEEPLFGVVQEFMAGFGAPH